MPSINKAHGPWLICPGSVRDPHTGSRRRGDVDMYDGEGGSASVCHARLRQEAWITRTVASKLSVLIQQHGTRCATMMRLMTARAQKKETFL